MTERIGGDVGTWVKKADVSYTQVQFLPAPPNKNQGGIMTEEFKPYKTDPQMGDYYQHPTFGIISIARTSCSVGESLFGSSILHSNTIRLRISHAELCRGLNNDHIFDRGVVVEVEMSPTQFADAITGLNVGAGTPVTIRYIAKSAGQDLTFMDVPFVNKVAQFNKEFDKDIKDLGKRFDETINLAKETHAQVRLIKEIEQLKMHFVSNIPFVNKQFSEQMAHTVKEAKGEVEAFVNHAITSYGIEAIRNQAPRLPEVTEVKELPQHGAEEAKQ